MPQLQPAGSGASPAGAAAGQGAGQSSCPRLRDLDPGAGQKRQAKVCFEGEVCAHGCLFCSDGEVPGGNPMVAGFQDDLDLDDKIPSRAMLAADRVPSKNVTLSSEDEEEEEVKDSKVTLIPDADIDTEQEKKRYEAQREEWGHAGKFGPLLSPATASVWPLGSPGVPVSL